MINSKADNFKISGRILNGLKKFEIGVLVGIFVVMFVLGISQIISRYVFNNPIAWGDEFNNMLEMVMTLLALGYCVRTKSNITVSGIYDRFPPKVRDCVSIVINIICILALYRVAAAGCKYAVLQWNVSYGTFGIPRGITYLAAPIGCTLASVNLVLDSIDHILMFLGKNAIFKFKKEEEDE